MRRIPYAGTNMRQPKIARRCPHGVYWPSTQWIAFGCQLCNPEGLTDITHRAYVYFIAAEDVCRVKIGIAQDVLERMRNLQIGSPAKLELLGFLAAHERTAPKIEAVLHARFQMYHSHGEWYKLTPTLRQRITAVVLGFTFANPKHPDEDVVLHRSGVAKALDTSPYFYVPLGL